MLTRIFIIGSIYTIIGICLALFQYYILRKKFIGKLSGAIIISLLGAFIGGVLGHIFDDQLQFIFTLNDTTNIIPPIVGALLFIIIFHKIGTK